VAEGKTGYKEQNKQFKTRKCSFITLAKALLKNLPELNFDIKSHIIFFYLFHGYKLPHIGYIIANLKKLC